MEKGTLEVKVSLAEMLKGGVIMDVTSPEQAKIAEPAGAPCLNALPARDQNFAQSEKREYACKNAEPYRHLILSDLCHRRVSQASQTADMPISTAMLLRNMLLRPPSATSAPTFAALITIALWMTTLTKMCSVPRVKACARKLPWAGEIKPGSSEM